MSNGSELKSPAAKALREAEKTARDYGEESYAAKMIGDAILALIEKEPDCPMSNPGDKDYET